MKKLLIILLLISPIHTSQALSLTEIVDWVKPLMPWYEQQPELTFELTDTKGNVFTEKNTPWQISSSKFLGYLVRSLLKRDSCICKIL